MQENLAKLFVTNVQRMANRRPGKLIHSYLKEEGAVWQRTVTVMDINLSSVTPLPAIPPTIPLSGELPPPPSVGSHWRAVTEA